MIKKDGEGRQGNRRGGGKRGRVGDGLQFQPWKYETITCTYSIMYQIVNEMVNIKVALIDTVSQWFGK